MYSNTLNDIHRYYERMEIIKAKPTYVSVFPCKYLWTAQLKLINVYVLLGFITPSGSESDSAQNIGTLNWILLNFTFLLVLTIL